MNSRTPGLRTAAAVSIDTILPFAMVLSTNTACACLARLTSPVYAAAPVTLSTPSTRFRGWPIRLKSFLWARCRQAQGTDDGSLPQLHLEGVVLPGNRAVKCDLGNLAHDRRFDAPAPEGGDGVRRRPGLMGDAAQHQPRVLHDTVLQVERGRHRHQGESKARAIAHLEISRVLAESIGRYLDRRDHLARRQMIIHLRRIAGQAQEFVERQLPATPRRAQGHRTVQLDQCDAAFRVVDRDAGLVPAQDGVIPIESLQGLAARSRLPFVAALEGRVVKIAAA